MTPDFLIIGAAKSGTRWLADGLAQNPACFLADTEAHYFSTYFERESAGWYAAHFAAARPDQLRGERSNSYMTNPLAAARIYAAAPDARLIAILRNPIDRAYSGYCMRLDRAKVTRDIAAHLDPANPLSRGIVENGLYHRQLSGFLALYPREQLHVALYDDIKTRPAEMLGEISAFLGAPHVFEAGALAKRANARKASGIPHVYKRLFKPLVRTERVRRAISDAVSGTAAGRAALRLISGTLTYPPLGDAERRKLAAYYADDVGRLSVLAGRDLQAWLG